MNQGHPFLSFKNLLAGLLLLFVVAPLVSKSQVVGIDNWYNRETSPKTGQLFHYLWTDTENSGYSQWGDLFKKEGASLATLGEAASKKNLLGSRTRLPVQNLVFGSLMDHICENFQELM